MSASALRVYGGPAGAFGEGWSRCIGRAAIPVERFSVCEHMRSRCDGDATRGDRDTPIFELAD
jgi:hypothetical protein